MTGQTWRLGHRPALDGLRGVAVLLVVAAHAGVPFIHSAGGVGVFMFFALSGFLITALLLEEREATDRIDFAAFYRRRAVRLLPALLALVAFVALVGAAAGDGPAWVDGWQVTGALFYFTNWLRVDGPVGALSHTWSLSVEEQFYLTWPLILVLALRFGRRWAVGLTAVLAAASAVWASVLWFSGAPFYRVVFGLDTRGCVMLAGCLLALWMHGRRESVVAPSVIAGSVIGLAVLTLTDGWVGVLLAPPLAGLGACALIAACAQGDGIGWLRAPWLRWVGRRSYAWYLWHYPFALALGAGAPDLPWPLRLVLLVAVSALCGEVSWRYVERPAQRFRSRRAPRARQTPAYAA